MITARHASKSLGDHLSGFLAANGVKDIPFEETSPICIYLNELPDFLSMRRLKDHAKAMRKRWGLKHNLCLEIIARSFGYANYQQATAQMTGDRLVRKD